MKKLLFLISIIFTAGSLFSFFVQEVQAETVILTPNGAGFQTQLLSKGDSPNWKCVDEEIPDDAATYVYNPSGTMSADKLGDLYTLSDLPEFGPETIYWVQFWIRCHMTGGDYPGVTAALGGVILRTHNTNYYNVLRGEEVGWKDLSWILETNPYTNLPWTVAELNDLQAGVYLWGKNIYRYSTQVYVEVNYTAVVAPTVSLSPSSRSGSPSQTLSYTATITNNDDSASGDSTFDLTKSCPSGWTCSLNKTSVTISPGLTDSSVTLSVTSPPTATAGDYTVSVTATNSLVTSYSGTGSATYTVVVPAPGEQIISISQGWNIISSPFEEPLQLSEIAAVCSLETYQGQTWAWTYSQENEWRQSDRVEKDEGIYVLSQEDCIVNLSGTPATFSSKTLKRGWNLISTEKSLEKIRGDCQIVSDPAIQTWDPQTENWVNPAMTDNLDPKKGYWTKVENDCTLEIIEVKITNIALNPTSLTDARHEYQTYLGLGYWGDPFTLSITFSNPYDFDVWVHPDYAFGHLTGEPLEYVEGALQGFNAEELLYFRLLLNTQYIQGDYSYTTDWQNLYHPQNCGSNMPQYVYDPDGIAVLTAGGDCWLKVPANGQATTVKDGHLGKTISVALPDVFDLCVAVDKAFYLVWDPHIRTVGGVQYTINYKSVALDPFADAVPDMVNITPI